MHAMDTDNDQNSGRFGGGKMYGSISRYGQFIIHTMQFLHHLYVANLPPRDKDMFCLGV